MCEQTVPKHSVHGRQLASYERRGVKRVFLLVCDKPRQECRSAASRVWPIHEAPRPPTEQCPLMGDSPDGTWQGCAYAPYFGALVVAVD